MSLSAAMMARKQGGQEHPYPIAQQRISHEQQQPERDQREDPGVADRLGVEADGVAFPGLEGGVVFGGQEGWWLRAPSVSRAYLGYRLSAA